jgi:hypothetical protein
MAGPVLLSVAYTWGSSPVERTIPFPCDRFLPDPTDTLFRAVDVAAPDAVIFRWLCQLRAAPYSYDWIDNGGRRSPREWTAGLEQLRVGQPVMTIFELVEFELDRHLTLALARTRSKKAFGEIAVSYMVLPRRLVVKLLLRQPGRLRAHALAWGDLIMMRKQLLTLKRLMEHSAREEPGQIADVQSSV